MTTYRYYLESEYRRRSARNQKYSLRAFARDLSMPASKLSEVLRGHCGLSVQSARRIARSIGLSEVETRHFLLLVEMEHGRSALARETAKTSLADFESSTKYGEVDLERFKIISDWYHFAILELTEIEDFQSDIKWIAKRLKISVSDAREAVERLLDFGLMERRDDGRFVQTNQHLATPSGIPSRQIRDHHSQILRKAERALEEVPVELREFSTTLLAIPESRLAEAKRMLVEFRRRFSTELQDAPEKDRVYSLSVQFFPVDVPNRPTRETK